MLVGFPPMLHGRNPGLGPTPYVCETPDSAALYPGFGPYRRPLAERAAGAAGMRKALGMEPGQAVIIEEREGELALKPAAVLEIERYSDEQIAAWDAEDMLSAEERQRILARLQGK